MPLLMCFRFPASGGDHCLAQALRLRDQRINELERKISNFMDAIENGQHSNLVIERLNSYEKERDELLATRDQLVPKPINLPDDILSLYRRYIDNLVATLTEEGVAGRASDELHELMDRVVVLTCSPLSPLV